MGTGGKVILLVPVVKPSSNDIIEMQVSSKKLRTIMSILRFDIIIEYKETSNNFKTKTD